MIGENKYFYIKDISAYESRRQPPHLMMWNPVYSVEVDEDVDWGQRIELSTFRLNQKDKRPASTKYSRVTAVIKEVFYSHYTLALKYIHEAIIDDGEFYLYKHSNDFFEIQYYSRDEKDKRSIQIDFREGVEYLMLTVDARPGHRYRPKFRKDAVAITDEQFRQFLNLTIQFFYDPDSMFMLLEDYIKNFKLLCAGETKIEGLIISVSKSFEEIFKQLDQRKEYIEKRLIENDADSNIDRVKLRGELEGINYAVKVINMNK